MIITTKRAEETKKLAGDILAKAFSDSNEASIIALRGDLGSGKTTFTQGLLDFFGLKEPATSPTFVIRKTYPIEYEGFTNLVHYDWYRIEDEKEILNIGFLDDIAHAENLVIIEWPEKAEALLPNNTFNINFQFVDENTRQISYEY